MLKKKLVKLYLVLMVVVLFSFQLNAKEINLSELSKCNSIYWNQPLEINVDTDVNVTAKANTTTDTNPKPDTYLILYSFETRKTDNYKSIDEISLNIKKCLDLINQNIPLPDTITNKVKQYDMMLNYSLKSKNDKNTKFVFKNLNFLGYLYIAVLKIEKDKYEFYEYKAIKLRRRFLGIF